MGALCLFLKAQAQTNKIEKQSMGFCSSRDFSATPTPRQPAYESNYQPDYERNYLLMNAHDKGALCFLFSVVNIEAYNEATKTASDHFLTWDILEDLMPFLPQPAIEVDIQWTKSDLEQKVNELGQQEWPIVILINPSKLRVIPEDSAVLGFGWVGAPCGISSLLDPTRVVMDATMSNVHEVGGGFLARCSSLEEVDLSCLRNLQKVGHGFLRGCSSLKEFPSIGATRRRSGSWPLR